MSIETEINRISTNVSNTLSAVSEMGGEVPEGATSDDMDSGVRSIPVGAKINDTTPSTTTTYSSSKIESEISKLNEANAALIEVDSRLSESIAEIENDMYGSPNLYINTKSKKMLSANYTSFSNASSLKGLVIPIDGEKGKIIVSRNNVGTRFRVATSIDEPNNGVLISSYADNDNGNEIAITPNLSDNWIYVIYYSTSLDTLSESELLSGMSVTYEGIGIKEKVNDLVNHIVPKMEFDFSSLKQLDFEIGGINTEGLLTDNANRYRTSNTYFGKDVEILCKNENVKFSVCEYDKNGNKIGFKNLNTSSYKMNGYKYFRICVAVSNDVYFNTNRYLCDILLNAFAVKGIVFGEPQSIPLRVVTSAKPVETYSNSLKPYVCTNSHNINVTEWEVTGKLNDLYSLYDGLVNEYPHLISREVLDTVTYDGKDYEIRLYTIRGISSNNANLSEVLWISSIHGCEEGAMLNTYLMCKEILENHELNDMLSFILSNCRLMIVPTINPYGIENRSRTNGKRFIYQGVEYQGVNLNRNFDADWSFSVPDVEGEGGAKKYNDPTFDFSGLEPNSEKETQVCMDLIKLHPNACMVVNNHNGSELSIAGHSYLYSAFNVDRRLGNAMCKTLEPHIIKNNLWILDANGIDAYNKDYASVVEPSSNVGTMDKWYYSKGYHGGLVEQSLRAGSAYSENHENDLLCIGVTYNINTIAMYILKNKDIVTSHESTKKYTSVKDESINLINAD